MLFCTVRFLIFFSIVFTVYWAALAAAAGLAAAGRQLLFLCQLELLAGPDHLRLHLFDYLVARHGRLATPRWRSSRLQASWPILACSSTSSTPISSCIRWRERPGLRRRRPRCRCSRSCCPSASPFTPSRRSTTPSTSIDGACRPSATWPTSCCSSSSFRTWWRARSSGRATSCRRFAGAKHWDWTAPATWGRSYFVARPVQEAGHRRPHGPVRRSGVRQPRRLFGRGAAWIAVARLRRADLLRFLRLHRHGPGDGPHAGLQAGAELQHALPVGQRGGVLAALAHLAVELAARLPVHPAGRQPRRRLPDVSGAADQPQSADHHDPGRPVARGQLDLRRSGACCTACC